MIDRKAELESFLEQLHGVPRIALDLEADSLYAFPERICLIQVGIPGRDELIDPLAGIDLTPLWEALQHRELVLHGADYDLRMLYRIYRFRPARIFETMAAARLLGRPELGLHRLVGREFGVELEKGPQKFNWAQRPLTPRMSTYARNDTRFLIPLAERLEQELASKERLDWHAEVCHRLIADCSEPRWADPDKIWRLKGSHRLNRLGLAILKELWEWREAAALRANKPPYFVLRHSTLIALASRHSETHIPIRRGLPPGLAAWQKKGIAAAIRRAKASPLEDRPRALAHKKPVGKSVPKSVFMTLKDRRDRRAAELQIDPTMIASREMLERLAEDWSQHSPKLMAWQQRLLS